MWRLSTIIKAMSKKQLKTVHPGEVLLEEFLKPMGLTQNRLALDIGVSTRRISEIVTAKRSVTARYFRISPQFWLGLQMDYDLDIASDALAKRLIREVKPSALAA